MATFDETLPSSPAAEEIIQKWLHLAESDGRLRNVVEQIQNDARVDAALWAELHAIVSASPASDILHLVRNWARSHVLSGPASHYFTPLTRVTNFEDFWRTLVLQAGDPSSSAVPLTETQARRLVQELCDPALWRRAVRRAQDLGLMLGQYVVWATFDPAGASPYAGLALSVNHVAASLGFDDPDTGDARWTKLPLLLLSYEPDHAFQPHFPTVVEALASDPLNYYFRVAPRGSRNGLTQTWRQVPIGVTPRPEIVHQPLPLSSLCQPITALHA